MYNKYFYEYLLEPLEDFEVIFKTRDPVCLKPLVDIYIYFRSYRSMRLYNITKSFIHTRNV
jgi:hypothetical protein